MEKEAGEENHFLPQLRVKPPLLPSRRHCQRPVVPGYLRTRRLRPDTHRSKRQNEPRAALRVDRPSTVVMSQWPGSDVIADLTKSCPLATQWAASAVLHSPGSSCCFPPRRRAAACRASLTQHSAQGRLRLLPLEQPLPPAGSGPGLFPALRGASCTWSWDSGSLSRARSGCSSRLWLGWSYFSFTLPVIFPAFETHCRSMCYFYTD